MTTRIKIGFKARTVSRAGNRGIIISAGVIKLRRPKICLTPGPYFQTAAHIHRISTDIIGQFPSRMRANDDIIVRGNRYIAPGLDS